MTFFESVDILDIVRIARMAGQAIMCVYSKDFAVEYKHDKSPLTEADKIANEIICENLTKLYPQTPIISEENKEIPYEVRKNYEYFWLIDPLDGTKEFINKNGEFTVNIALICNGEPKLGVVYAPAIDLMYYAKRGDGAFKIADNITTRLTLNRNDGRFVVVASKSHNTPETQDFIQHIKTDKQIEFISMGSSIKLCLVASGEADIYPRLAPTMEWDTAAADAIVRECGKMSVDFGTNEPLKYNKENMLNPWFVVS